ncbi:DUF2235 domain-containing protein [Pantoea sp. CTOTU49201]|uniref:T6SS phospholipase effector Tle1-like catalytic domain-containing protein n=1 Tax=Pantoea sp. CTOTU49201 TaxID=2953855 RepID=UPI0028989A01|nr:DUF2235 domain-containing protein [Pantoea sp. CTOTU49201]
MSKIKTRANVWAPPLFPENGRIPVTHKAVIDNYLLQKREEEQYLQQFNAQTERRNGAGFTCSQSLHISFFFDGTGNNEDNDTNHSSPTHPTNIAKLYHATYDKTAESEGYYRYYMPGVGTAFPEIGEMNYSSAGLAYATGGEARINWALLHLADALVYAVTNVHIQDEVIAKKISGIAADWPFDNPQSRKAAFYSFLNADIRAKVATAKPKLLKIKLFIYGFSRGAAEARTFVNWLTDLFESPKGADKPDQAILGIPLSIEFLGLLDTVPSVGIAHIAPLVDGHMGWANNTQLLPNEKRFPHLIKCCRHFVSAHEQRLCFPLDSVCRPGGGYPPATQEVIYPGMHSDIGGGYPQGDQGKGQAGKDSDDPNYSGNLLSQIILHDLYAAAYAAGAPLMVPEDFIPQELLQKKPSRIMSTDTEKEFAVSNSLIQRFNAWRQTILSEKDQTSLDQQCTIDEGYIPHLLSQSLDDAVADQIGLITAWRIGRYANGSYASQPFYLNATQHSKEMLEQTKKVREEKAQKIEYLRKAAKLNPALKDAGKMLNQAGPPDFEPLIDKQQLQEAADEFKNDYLNKIRPQSWSEFVLNQIPKGIVWLINTDDEITQQRHIKQDGERLYPRLFSSKQGTVTPDPTIALVVALFDDQIHDSRAWFMHSALGTREPWGGYFFYRSIYYGSQSNKDQYLFSIHQQLIGVPVTNDGASYRVKNNALYYPVSSTGNAEVQNILPTTRVDKPVPFWTVIDNATGKAIPLQDGTAQLLNPTREPGTLVSHASQQMLASQHQAMMASAVDMLKSSGARVV